MASKRSFCDKGLVRHGLFVRFWPLMVIYFAVMAFVYVLPMVAELEYYQDIVARTPDLMNRPFYALTYMGEGAFMSAAMGLVAAVATFGYVNNTRSVNFYHALPMRRESLFISQSIVGLLLIFIPVVAIALILLAVTGFGGVLVPAMLAVIGTWLAKALLGGFVFYSIGVLCAMICGNSIAMVVVYLVFNAFAPVMGSMLFLLAKYNIFGLTATESGLINLLCPFFQIAYSETLAEAMIYLPVGVALWFAALALYRKRHVENAGEIIAIPFLRPLFKYGFAACFSILLTMFIMSLFFLQGFSSSYHPDNLIPSVVSLIAFGVIGILIAQMLLMKSFRIPKTVLKGASIFAGCIIVLAVVVATDLTGFERWLPDQDQVQIAKVEVWTTDGGNWGRYDNRRITSYAFGGQPEYGAYINSDGYGHNFANAATSPVALNAQQNAIDVVAQQETIKKLLAAHENIAKNGRGAYEQYDNGDYRFVEFRVTYLLRNGNVAWRGYVLPYTGEMDESILALMNSQELRGKRYLYYDVNPAAAKGGALYLDGYSYDSREDGLNYIGEKDMNSRISFDKDEAATLLAAVLADIDEGNLGNLVYNMDQMLNEDVLLAMLNIDYLPENPYLHKFIDTKETDKQVIAQTFLPLTANATHTLAALKDLGVGEEYLITHAQLADLGYDLYYYGVNNDAGKDLYLDQSMYESQ